MGLFVVRAPGTVSRFSSSLRFAGVRGPHVLGLAIERLGEWIERTSWAAPALLLALYVPLVIVEAHSNALSNDEIYTVHIARAPTLGRMLWMARETDLHPPLHYLLQRLVLHLPGPPWLISRLPSMIAGWVMTMTVFRMTARRLGALLGVVSVAAVWSTPALRFFWLNRPYMIWLALLALLIAAWGRASVPGRSLWRLVVVFCLSALMISDQLIGIACLLPFVLAEMVRARQSGRLDWRLLLALLVPSLVGAGYFYQLRHLSQNSFPGSQLPTVGWALGVYNALVTQTFFLLSVSMLLTVFLGADWRLRRTDQSDRRDKRLSLPEWTLFLGLLATPLLLMLIAAVLGLPYWERYGSFAALWTGGNAAVAAAPARATVAPAFDSTGAGVHEEPALARLVADWGPVHAEQGSLATSRRPRLALSALDHSLPIVAANPMTFNEMADREPQAVTNRLFYLTDREAAKRYSGYTLFENENKIVAILGLPAHAEAREQFLATHSRFYLVANFNSDAQWLPSWLADHGARHELSRKVSSQRMRTTILYLVTVAAGS